MLRFSPVVFLALSLMTACLGQPHPVKNRFILAVPEASPSAVDAAGRRTLLLGAVTAAPAYEGRALVYRLGPDRYESDFYNEFLAPPTRLLAEVAADRLTRAGRRLGWWPPRAWPWLISVWRPIFRIFTATFTKPRPGPF